MGISEKTLKRWFVKYPTLPVIKSGYRCLACTDWLMLWSVAMQLDEVPENLIYQAKADSMGMSIEEYMARYVYQTVYPDGIGSQGKRKDHPKYYRKSIERTQKLLSLFTILRSKK